MCGFIDEERHVRLLFLSTGHADEYRQDLLVFQIHRLRKCRQPQIVINFPFSFFLIFLLVISSFSLLLFWLGTTQLTPGAWIAKAVFCQIIVDAVKAVKAEADRVKHF